jgi:hypothetical protein
VTASSPGVGGDCFLAFPIRMLTVVDTKRKLGRLIGEMQAQTTRCG